MFGKLSSPNPFLCGVSVGIAIGCVFYYQLFFLQAGNPPPKGGARHAATIQRKIDQALEIDGPKFLLVGGSSVGCGISARMISQELSVPAYNFSFWASLGSPYILHLAKKVLKPGDTVLLCLEYEILDWPGISPYWLDQSFLRFVMGFDPKFIKEKPFIEKLWTAYSMPPGHILSGLTSWIRGGERINFDFYETHNQFGDSIQMTVQNKNKNLKAYEARIREPSEIFMTGFQGIPKGTKPVWEFLSWAENNNVKVLATYPNLARNEKYSPAENQRVSNQITEMYRRYKIKPIGSLEDSMYDQFLYYDTNYHLLVNGLEIRTKNLVKFICLKNSPQDALQ
jgi:hypothetical protein